MENFVLDFNSTAVQAVAQQVKRFAENQLRNAELAEDVLQEALLAAHCYEGRFAGLSCFRAWLFAVTKNKVLDHLRSKYRNPAAIANEMFDDQVEHEIFTKQGRWCKGLMPQAWVDPALYFDRVEFWQVFEICLNSLPPVQARVFMMREFLDFDAQEVCKELDISYPNFKVLMHRARLRIRACLELKWFGGN
ncbi:sigma-70 family RNA polymerase sigma factor [Limnobacter sp.]|uniref:sigma-70 family RNA polymerase sigma factor n=1 Tax=Limnobacter sp. TaxID=2003368 RepID=UPI0027327CDC|nr:sigma-70 family RNA polymerase sigma factor [Limnobacter sp.]MDP3189058.1 sigma-70 family RNA polymerase sigma factor [Limnobacter sp.]